MAGGTRPPVVRRFVGSAGGVPEDPEDERLAVGEVPPAFDAARLGDQRLAASQHRPAGRELHLDEAARDRDELDALVDEPGVADSPARAAARRRAGRPAVVESGCGRRCRVSGGRAHGVPGAASPRSSSSSVTFSLALRSSSVSSERPRWPRSPARSRSARRRRAARGRSARARARSATAAERRSRAARRRRRGERRPAVLDPVAEHAAFDPRRAPLRLLDAQPTVLDDDDALCHALDLAPHRLASAPSARATSTRSRCSSRSSGQLSVKNRCAVSAPSARSSPRGRRR